jgi:hypothetical protein
MAEDRGVEVELLKPFAVIRETLERIGIANKDKKFFPSCYAKKVDGKVKIYHFKELLKVPTMDDSDVRRKNSIIWLLIKWNLVNVLDVSSIDAVSPNEIFVLTKAQKDSKKWTIVHKYHFEKKINEKKH